MPGLRKIQKKKYIGDDLFVVTKNNIIFNKRPDIFIDVDRSWVWTAQAFQTQNMGPDQTANCQT